MEYGLVALWLALYLVLLVAGSVVASWLFPRFEDYGSGVAVPLAITVLWFVVFFLGRVSLTAGVWLGVAVLIGLTVLAGTRGVEVDFRRVGETCLVFSAAFLFWIGMRVYAVPLGAADPVIAPLPLAIGEKMLDFGLLQSLLRAETLPPEDMWFAGEPVAYYYGGHLVAAILARITGTAGRFAYNLALSGFFAMLVTAVYGVAGNVAADRQIPRRFAGGLSAFAVGIASNLTTSGRFLLSVLPEGVASPIAGVLGIELDGLANRPRDFGYFDASRVITDRSADFAFQFPEAGPTDTSPTINEFPFFAWFNGDMHAHMMSTAFLVLAAAICYSYYRTPSEDVTRRRLLMFGVLPPVAGLLAVTNTWSFPTPAGLALLTVLLAPSDARSLLPDALGDQLPGAGLGREGSHLLVGLGVGVAVVVLGLLWSLPFWLGPASGREIAFLPDRSSLGELLLVHGLFVAVFGAYLYGRSRQVLGDRAGPVAAAFAGGVLLFGLADLAALGLFLPLVAGCWALARDRSIAARYGGPAVASAETPAAESEDAHSDGGTPSATEDGSIASSGTQTTGSSGLAGFEIVLIVAGIGLVTLVEFVYLEEGTGRMNTVFKVYMQVWVLWSVAFGPALAWLLANRVQTPSVESGRPRSLALRIALVALVVSAGLYAPLAISSSFEASDPTIDGLSYLESEYPAEAQAIHWLDAREGRPVIVTAAPGGYTWDPAAGKGASAPASLTGLPTVLGWFHEAQYRGDEPYRQRLSDVGTIYTGDSAQQAALLAEYDVRYVYVGPAERAKYGQITVDRITGVEPIQRFQHTEGSDEQSADGVQNLGVTIYRVDETALPESE